MKAYAIASLICLSLLLGCSKREEKPVELAQRQAPISEVPQTPTTDLPRDAGHEPSSVQERRAVRLAKEDATKLLKSLDGWEILSSKLDNGWMVTVQLKNMSPLISGGRIDYLISNKGDRILDKKRYQ
jgi:hypothetical protein